MLSVGIVGSRRCSPYGEREARRIGDDLARLRVTVVSGLARGIDTQAHRGALTPKGGTRIDFLGHGFRHDFFRVPDG